MLKIILFIITAIFCFGSIWTGRLSWIAGQGTSTGCLGDLIIYGLSAIILGLIAIGFGIWAILRKGIK